MSGYLQGRGIHVDRHLTEFALNYRPQGFIADMVFPVVNVDKQSNLIKTYSQADLFRRERTLRAPGTEANRISTQVGSDSYACLNYELRGDVTVEDRANADAAFLQDLEQGRIMRLMDALSIDWEVRVATQATTIANVGTGAAVGSAWTDYTNSNPWGDIETQINNVEDATGYRPNRVVFSGTAWRHFRRNNKVIDKTKATGLTGAAQNATEQEVAQLLGVDRVMVGFGYYNTAQEGIANSLSRIWGDHVLVYYAPERPSIEIPSFGYTIRWTGNGLSNMAVTRLPFNPATKSDGIQIGYYQDEKILSSALGALITNTTSST